MKASLYARVSTSNQTCDPQLVELSRYCDHQQWKIHREYVDHGCSGSHTDRDALKRLMKDIQTGQAGDVVVVWKIDRLARSTADLLKILNHLQAHGVDFCATTQAIDTTSPYGRMVLTFLAAIAEFERETIIERVKSGLDRAKENGVQLGRPRVGFDVNRALDLKRQGQSWAKVAKSTGVSVSTLRRTLSDLLKNPPPESI